MTQFGGRGGGRPEMARGGGLAASADTIIAAIRRRSDYGWVWGAARATEETEVTEVT